MSLKDKLKKSWADTKKEWKASSNRKKKLSKIERKAYFEEKKKQADVLGKSRARLETTRRLREMRRPSSPMVSSPMFSAGLFGEPISLRRPARHIRKKTAKSDKTVYVNGVEIRTGSRPSNRRKVVRRKKRVGFYDPLGLGGW
jgi:hypothetical protein